MLTVIVIPTDASTFCCRDTVNNVHPSLYMFASIFSLCVRVWVCPYVHMSCVSLQSKISIDNTEHIAQFSAYQNVRVSDCRIGYIHDTLIYVCVCVWSGARVYHAISHPRPRQCPRPRHRQTAVGFTRARRQRSETIDRLQESQVGISRHSHGA